MFMTHGPINQSGQGSATERSARHVAAQYSVARGDATAIASVRPFRAASLPVSGGSDSSGPARRSLRSYGPDHTQASGGDGTSSSGLCEKKRSDDRSDRDPCVGHVTEYSAKAWLSPAPDTGRLKFSLTIRLIVCTIRSLPRHTVFWCPLGNVRLAIA
jgi:hypothetical protein